MVVKSYNSQIQEEPLEHPKDILEDREKYGLTETAKRLARNLNERGIRAAGVRSLPLYGIVAFFGIMILAAVISSVGGTIVAALSALLVLVVGLGFWVGSPLIVYWDCKAAERYINETWHLGKLIAASGFFVGPAALFFQLVYRARKF